MNIFRKMQNLIPRSGWYKDEINPIRQFIEDKWNWFWCKPAIFLESVERFFYWGWKLRSNYDFDYEYMLEMMLLKMKRLQKALNYENEQEMLFHKEHNPDVYQSRKALRLAIILLDRYLKDEYSDKGYERLEQKYGKFEFQSTPTDETKKYYTIDLLYGNVSTKELSKSLEYQKDRNFIEWSLNRRVKDYKLVFKLLEKHGQGWWD